MYSKVWCCTVWKCARFPPVMCVCTSIYPYIPCNLLMILTGDKFEQSTQKCCCWVWKCARFPGSNTPRHIILQCILIYTFTRTNNLVHSLVDIDSKVISFVMLVDLQLENIDCLHAHPFSGTVSVSNIQLQSEVSSLHAICIQPYNIILIMRLKIPNCELWFTNHN